MRFLLGLIVGILLLPLLAFTYVFLGYAPVATAGSPFPLERTLAKAALNARINKEAPKGNGPAVTEDTLLDGAQVYKEYCAVCHGMAGQPKTPTAKGMYPPPPQLFHGKGVTDDPAGESYWKVANGIRLTGMPAYTGSLTDAQIWHVSQLLANANQLPPKVTAFLAAPAPAK